MAEDQGNSECGQPLMTSFSDASDFSDTNNSRTSDINTVSSDVIKPCSIPRGCFGSVGFFVANLCTLLLLHMIMMTYNISIVRTIEKRFGLTSTQTGLTWSANDFSHICLVTFVAYFAGTSHKPRILSITMSFSAVAAALMILPFILYPRHSQELVNSYNATSATEHKFCVLDQGTEEADFQCTASNSTLKSPPGTHGAWYIFLFAQLLNGVGGTGLQTLGLAYIEDNISKARTNFYIGERLVSNC